MIYLSCLSERLFPPRERWGLTRFTRVYEMKFILGTVHDLSDRIRTFSLSLFGSCCHSLYHHLFCHRYNHDSQRMWWTLKCFLSFKIPPAFTLSSLFDFLLRTNGCPKYFRTFFFSFFSKTFLIMNMNQAEREMMCEEKKFLILMTLT